MPVVLITSRFEGIEVEINRHSAFVTRSWQLRLHELTGRQKLGLDSFQQDVERMTQSWSHHELEGMMLLLTEEVGELARALRKMRGQRWGHDDESVGSTENVMEELGDVLFLLARISVRTGTDLGDAATAVLGKIERRMAQSE